MSAPKVSMLALVTILLVAAGPAQADDGAYPENPTCVTIWTDPPDARVDPDCIWVFVDDLIPGHDE